MTRWTTVSHRVRFPHFKTNFWKNVQIHFWKTSVKLKMKTWFALSVFTKLTQLHMEIPRSPVRFRFQSFAINTHFSFTGELISARSLTSLFFRFCVYCFVYKFYFEFNWKILKQFAHAMASPPKSGHRATSKRTNKFCAIPTVKFYNSPKKPLLNPLFWFKKTRKMPS